MINSKFETFDILMGCSIKKNDSLIYIFHFQKIPENTLKRFSDTDDQQTVVRQSNRMPLQLEALKKPKGKFLIFGLQISQDGQIM